MALQSFDFERTWWRLLQKRVVHTKFDIYVLSFFFCLIVFVFGHYSVCSSMFCFCVPLSILQTRFPFIIIKMCNECLTDVILQNVHLIWMFCLSLTAFTVFRLLTDFVCLYTYGFWLSLCKIVRSSVILLLPLINL